MSSYFSPGHKTSRNWSKWNLEKWCAFLFSLKIGSTARWRLFATTDYLVCNCNIHSEKFALKWQSCLVAKSKKKLIAEKAHLTRTRASAITVGVLLSCTGKQLKNYTFKFFSCFPVHNKEPFTLCCISFRRCCFGLESHPSYPINADWFYVMGMKQKNVFWKKNGRLKNWVFHNH